MLRCLVSSGKFSVEVHNYAFVYGNVQIFQSKYFHHIILFH